MFKGMPRKNLKNDKTTCKKNNKKKNGHGARSATFNPERWQSEKQLVKAVKKEDARGKNQAIFLKFFF